MEDTSLLHVSHLKKAYRVPGKIFDRGAEERCAVNDVSFSLQAGQTLGLVGESGCGKTTLSRLVIRLIDADEGAIYFYGEDITHMPEKELRRFRPRMQMIFQNPYSCFDPTRKIFESLAEPLREYGMIDEMSDIRTYLTETMDECGLAASFLDRYPREFSGGQLQRLAIVRALAMKPELIIADEVVSALDVTVQDQILGLFEQLTKKRGLGLLFISHDLAVIRRISDYIIVMKAGRFVDEGDRTYIFRCSENSYTRDLVKAIPAFPF